MHDLSGLRCCKNASKPTLTIFCLFHLVCRMGEKIPTCCNYFNGKFHVVFNSISGHSYLQNLAMELRRM